MNKFKSIATKLISKHKWVNFMTLIEIIPQKSIEKRLIYVQKNKIENIPCILKQTTKFNSSQNVLNKFTTFTTSSQSIEDKVDFNSKFKILFNDKEYFVQKIIFEGTLNNENTLINFQVVQ